MRDKTFLQKEKTVKFRVISVITAATVIWIALLVHFIFVGRNIFIRDQKERAFFLSEQLDRYIYKTRDLTRLVVENPYIINRLRTAPALSDNMELNRDISVALESIKMSSSAAIVYVMNPEGVVIASTEYDNGKRLTGQIYTFRPYFREALGGQEYIYAAIGVTTGQRGLYFSAPIFFGEQDRPLGVLVVKMGLETVDDILSKFKGIAGIFGRDGVIFATNQKEWLFHAARPISDAQINQLRLSLQFAGETLSPLPFSLDAPEIKNNRRIYNVVQLPIAIPGWNLFTLQEKRIHFPLGSAVLATVILLLLSLLVLFNIINNRKKRLLEQARRKAEEELIKGRQLESIGILAAGVAHDFNNHLSIILGNIFFIKEKMSPDDPNYKYLVNAEKEIQYSNELAAKLITFAKGGWLDRGAVKTADLLAEVAKTFKLNYDITLKLETAENVRDILCDRRPVKQALAALVQNALESMDFQGEVTLRATNVEDPIQELKAGENTPPLLYSEYVRISVIDSGRGIPEDILPKIFDPYFSTKDNWTQKGMGLGLTLCYSIVDKHEGFISVESDIGVGTTVHVYLPCNGDQFK